jgi:DNA-binding response OmpR family regulator
MTVTPSCPALVIHEDDAFRRTLIATLDQKHFSVTVSPDGEEAVNALRLRAGEFKVVLVGVDLKNRKGMQAVEYLRDHRDAVVCGVILLGEPTPELRTFAPWADETLMKPVDATYVAQRAIAYCNC